MYCYSCNVFVIGVPMQALAYMRRAIVEKIPQVKYAAYNGVAYSAQASMTNHHPMANLG